MFSVSDINTINALLSPIVEEYRALRNEIASLNKQQYNMAFLFFTGLYWCCKFGLT